MPWFEKNLEEDDSPQRRVQAWIDSTTPPRKRRRITSQSDRKPLGQISNVQAQAPERTLISPDFTNDNALSVRRNAEKDEDSSEMENDRKILGLPPGPTLKPKMSLGFDSSDDRSEDTSLGMYSAPTDCYRLGEEPKRPSA
jgi:hypothetical protein